MTAASISGGAAGARDRDSAGAAAMASDAGGGGLGRRRHILDLDDFSAEEIGATLDNADAMRDVLARDIKKAPALRGRVIVTLFYEASTRTRISFEEAGKILSADVINMTGSASSVTKGESLLNTGLTLQAMGVDAVVIRHPHAGAPHLLARNLPRVAVINAGDGAHAHPTQGLLDLYTARRHLGGLAGRKVVIVGDALHSRVARSALWGFARMGAQVTLCGPPTLMPYPLTAEGWGADGAGGTGYAVAATATAGGPVGFGTNASGPGGSGGNGGGRNDDRGSLGDGGHRQEDGGNPLGGVRIEPDLDAAIAGADLVMALRIQRERQERGFFPSLREYIRRWQVNEGRMALASPGALLMHPGPMNEGVEVSTGLAHGERSLIEEQVTNGVAIRMALLYQLVGAVAAAE